VTPDEIVQIDEQLRLWRQGDVFLTDAVPAIHLAHMAAPGTPASAELAAALNGAEDPPDLAIVSLDVAGFMVTSQTCDVVRTCIDRPYVELCPLLPIDADKMPQVRLGRVPRYVWASGLGEANLAADLELVVTLEKATLVRFGDNRQAGVAGEAEARTLAEALGRKRSRAAFPDDFSLFVAPLQRRILERHNRDSDEGRFLRGMREIRVVARPSWQADAIDIELLFVFEAVGTLPADAEAQTNSLVGRLTPGGRYTTVEARATGLDALSAATYVASDRLDLDHLSVAP
jgi:hypothetical protein